MRINTIPVEAYRRANESAAGKNQAAEEKSEIRKAPQTQKIFLPGVNTADAGSIKAPSSPSMLNGVLSSEEKTLLIRHFARFGDTPESSQIYSTDAQVRAGAMTGIKLDVKG